jgi:hypothetical protein
MAATAIDPLPNVAPAEAGKQSKQIGMGRTRCSPFAQPVGSPATPAS